LNGRERCLAAIRGGAVDRTPLFPLLMFLAADRSGISYRRFATDGRALAEAQLKAREPELAFATPAQAQAAARDRLRRAAGARYLLSAGCEVPATVSDQTFRAFCGAR
jgi:uroporphyrinogen-III decarboxylase